MGTMDQKQLDDYVKKIEEFVIDEGQIVTYKWLSRCLGIHVNTSKQLLHYFLSTHGKSYGADISASHEISGVKADGSHRMLVVNDCQLPEARSSLVDVWSEHVYSVQKMKTITDFQLLYAVDPLETTRQDTGSAHLIFSVCADSVSLAFAAMRTLKRYSAVSGKLTDFHTRTITCAPITCKECFEKSESELRPVYETTTDKPEKSKTSKALLATAKTDLKPVKGKAAVGSEEKGTKAQDESVEEVTKKVTEVKIDAKEKSTNQAKIQKKTNSISSMFSAQNQKAKNTKVVDKKVEKPEKEVPMTVVEEEKEKQMEVETIETKKPAEVASKKSSKAKTKRKPTPKQEDPKEKKRKRIRVFSDSDDSEPGSDKERCPSPEPESDPEPAPESAPQVDIESDQEDDKAKPSTSGDGSQAHKRKKRKIVDKLVMTDEGYMETTKEVVFETDSETEPEPTKPVETKKSPMKTAKPETAKKAASAASPKKKGKGKPSDGRKQASLLSFFKKT